ncbi:hypothetical protein [Anaerobaca lacustris]|uniref:Exo-alpha-sialidase n=1 Tax=Anaerobaca lacustris TaxID=3044600 RepID=A0AAW6TTM4_9BACT|nr:hypothetical protein [Sedimentisphaerales bacterium M17dextr]
MGIGSEDRIAVPLPQEDEIPDLGLDGESLMAVYSKTIYRLTDRTWTPIHSGDILLPRSGLPPQRHGNMVFLRDEGMRLSHKRLWWLTMGERPRLRLLSRDTGLFVPTVRQTPYAEEVDLIGPPGWEETSSYCVTSTGDLWACIANGSFLLRRSQEGWYSIAMANNAVRFGRESVDSSVPDHHVSVSAITTLHDDTFLLTGNTGLYRLKGNELVQKLAFAGAEPQTGPDRAPRRLNWHPTSVLSLDDGSYLIGCGSGRGVYLLSRGDDGHWSARFAEQGDPVVW